LKINIRPPEPVIQNDISTLDSSSNDYRNRRPHRRYNGDDHGHGVVADRHVVGVPTDRPEVIVIVVVIIIVVVIVDVGENVGDCVESEKHGGQHVVGVEPIFSISSWTVCSFLSASLAVWRMFFQKFLTKYI